MTQNKRILNYLEQGKKLTPIQALKLFDCFRLSARILELRQKGYNIETKNITKNGKTFAEYTLEK
jgi:hypothetical protein